MCDGRAERGMALNNTAARCDGRRLQAYLTVFMALCLPVLLSLFLTVIEGARQNAMRLQAEMAMDTATQSVLAEFHQELHKQYDLFFVDTAYGTGAPSLDRTAEHLRAYLEGNFTVVGVDFFRSRVDFQDLHVGAVDILGARFAADDGGAPVREQVYAYMTADPATSALAGMAEELSGVTTLEQEAGVWQSTWQENQDALHALEPVTEVGADGTEHEVALEDPTKEVTAYRFRPALLQVLGTTDGVSQAAVAGAPLLSHRERTTGNDPQPDTSHRYPEADAVLMGQYILEKCGRWRDVREEDHLKYQCEYILFGEESDEANLEKMAARLLLVRNAANCAYIFTDAEKGAAADALAATITFLLLVPEAQPIVKTAILLGWAYSESVSDVRRLFDGARVPLFKNKSDWRTPLVSILSPGSFAGGGGGGGGLSYEDYLRLFLLAENETTRTLRLMDMMEADLRDTPGNEAFRLDACFDVVAAKATVQSGFGYSLEVQRAGTFN